MANGMEQGGIPETGVATDSMSMFMDGLATLNTAGTDEDRNAAISTLEQFKASTPNMPLHEFVDQIIAVTEPAEVEEEAAPVQPNSDFLATLEQNEAQRNI